MPAKRTVHRCALRNNDASWDFSCLGCSHSSVSRRTEKTTHQQTEPQKYSLQIQRMELMAGLSALCLLLMLPLSGSQSTLQSEREMGGQQAPAAPAPPPRIQDLLRKEENTLLNTKRTYTPVDSDNAKIVLFIAASAGTFFLMAAVYCIYNKFYTKHQYLHTQLNDDPDVPMDCMDPPPVFFHASASSSAMDIKKSGYGSLSDTPSIISAPPFLSPPPSAMRFPPLFLSSQSLRTISAQDLEKSCI